MSRPAVARQARHRLYRNRAGRAGFTDVTALPRVGSPLWSASCAFSDLDRDGDLELFVTNYVRHDRPAISSAVMPSQG